MLPNCCKVMVYFRSNQVFLYFYQALPLVPNSTDKKILAIWLSTAYLLAIGLILHHNIKFYPCFTNAQGGLQYRDVIK